MGTLIKKQYYWGYLVILSTLLLTLALYFGSMAYYDDWYDYQLKYLAKVGSLGATLLMCWAFILATRFRLVELLFGGLDKVYKAHRRVGEAAFLLIVLHPLFLALDPQYSFLRFFWIQQFPGEETYHYLARMTGLIALLFFIVLMVLSLWRVLRYHLWKQTHNFFGVLLLIIVLHALVAQGEILSYPLLAAWFAVWIFAALLSYVYIRILYRWFGPLYEYVVEEVKKPQGILEIYLKPLRPRRKMQYRPGQFLYIYFDSDELSSEMHPFSISSAPQADAIRISIKELGDWTEMLHKLNQGDRAFIWGPYGKFGDHIFRHPEKEVVLLGGGIGITPFLSMVEDEKFLVGKCNKIHLFYSVEKPEDAYYHQEIEQLDRESRHLHYIPHCSQESGYLNAEIIANKVGGDLSGKVFLICGPKPMMESLQKGLLEAGVPYEQIFKEDFSVI